MGFELCEPGRFNSTAVLSEDEGTLSNKGTLVVHAEALAAIGVTDSVVVLADAGSLRIALRVPRDGESDRAVRVTSVKAGKRITSRRRVTVSAGLRKLSLEAKAVVGRHTLSTQDDLLILNLMPAGSDARGARQALRRSPGFHPFCYGEQSNDREAQRCGTTEQ